MKRKQAYLALLCPVKSHLFLLILFLISVLSLPANCQFYEPSEKTIRLGEPLPQSFYQAIHKAVNVKTGKLTTLKFDEYREKLVILDFWATWCGPCIYSLNKLDSIQAALGTEAFVVIPVTYETAKKAAPAFERFKWDMISIVADTILGQIFPHKGIPHQVWIRDNKVIALPHWQYATAENIKNVIKGRNVQMHMNIQDSIINPLNPIVTGGEDDLPIPYYSAITKQIYGVQTKLLDSVRQEGTFVMYALNNNIKQLFYSAFKPDIYDVLTATYKKGMHWEISDSLKNMLFKRPALSDNADYKADKAYFNWLRENQYSYQLKMPEPLNIKEAYRKMQEDLNCFFRQHLGIEGRIEKRSKKFAVLGLTGTKEEAKRLLRSKGKPWLVEINDEHYRLRYVGLRSFRARIGKSGIAPGAIFVNRTGIPMNYPVDYDLPRSIDGNLKKAQEELAKYGLDLQIEEREVPVLVIREL